MFLLKNFGDLKEPGVTILETSSSHNDSPKISEMFLLHVNQLFESGKCQFLDTINFKILNFIAGPLNANKNHWLAFILDFTNADFILLDPMQQE